MRATLPKSVCNTIRSNPGRGRTPIPSDRPRYQMRSVLKNRVLAPALQSVRRPDLSNAEMYVGKDQNDPALDVEEERRPTPLPKRFDLSKPDIPRPEIPDVLTTDWANPFEAGAAKRLPASTEVSSYDGGILADHLDPGFAPHDSQFRDMIWKYTELGLPPKLRQRRPSHPQLPKQSSGQDRSIVVSTNPWRLTDQELFGGSKWLPPAIPARTRRATISALPNAVRKVSSGIVSRARSSTISASTEAAAALRSLLAKLVTDEPRNTSSNAATTPSPSPWSGRFSFSWRGSSRGSDSLDGSVISPPVTPGSSSIQRPKNKGRASNVPMDAPQTPSPPESPGPLANRRNRSQRSSSKHTPGLESVEEQSSPEKSSPKSQAPPKMDYFTKGYSVQSQRRKLDRKKAELDRRSSGIDPFVDSTNENEGPVSNRPNAGRVTTNVPPAQHTAPSPIDTADQRRDTVASRGKGKQRQSDDPGVGPSSGDGRRSKRAGSSGK